MACANHDYRCPTCGALGSDVAVPISVGARGWVVLCQSSVHPDRAVRMEWIPQIGGVDAGSGASFKAFAITETVRGREVTTQIDSLHTLRKVERESEQLSRNGEGRPLVWRDYSQGKSNGDVHTSGKDIGDPHGVRQVLAKNKHQVRSGAAVTAAHGKVGE